MMQDVDGLSPKKAAEYIPATIGKNEEEYWSNVGGEAARQKLTSLARTTGRIEWTGDIKAAKATDYDLWPTKWSSAWPEPSTMAIALFWVRSHPGLCRL